MIYKITITRPSVDVDFYDLSNKDFVAYAKAFDALASNISHVESEDGLTLVKTMEFDTDPAAAMDELRAQYAEGREAEIERKESLGITVTFEISE